MVSLCVAVIQVAAATRRRAPLPYLPAALAGTGVAVLTGLFLALGAEFRWVDGALLDNLALPLIVAATWWIFHNRLRSAGNRPTQR